MWQISDMWRILHFLLKILNEKQTVSHRQLFATYITTIHIIFIYLYIYAYILI